MTTKAAVIRLKVEQLTASQTGAAKDETLLFEENINGIYNLNVLANDPGSAILHSLGPNPADNIKTITVQPTGNPAWLTKEGPIPQWMIGATISISADGTRIDISAPKHNSLLEGQVANYSFDYTIKMSNGALSTATVTVSITGDNDVTILNVPETVTIAEIADASSQDIVKTGSLTVTDLDVGQALVASVVGSPTLTLSSGTLSTEQSAELLAALGTGKLSFGSATSNGGQQTLDYTYDPSVANLDFLQQGQSLTVTYNVKVNDSTTQALSFTINGTNDAAVIGTPTVAAVTEDVAANDAGKLVAEGTISITDADAGQNQFQTAVTAAAGTLGTLTLQADGSYTYSVDNSAVQYLGATQFKTETFTVKALDGTTQALSFTINGTNDAAVIGTPTVAAVTEDVAANDAGKLVAEGTISITDADAGQNQFQTAVTAAAGTLGTLTLQADGSYTYSVDNSAVQYLGATQFKTETFTVKALDGTTQALSFTINGKDEINNTSGNNTYTYDVVAGGNPVISDLGGTDSIILNGNAIYSRLSFEKVENNLHIRVNNLNIVVENQYPAGSGTIETIQFGISGQNQSYYGYVLSGTYKLATTDVVNDPGNTRYVLAGDSGVNSLTGADGAASGGDLVFGNGGDDVIYGRKGHDLLVGGQGIDRLYGDEGNDTFVGGANNDHLYAGTGNDNDIFVFNSETSASTIDTIYNFQKSGSSKDFLKLVDGIAISNYTLESGNTHINLINGNQSAGKVVLVGVQISSQNELNDILA